MRKGTTPTHIFDLPFPASLVQEAEITYMQGGQEVLKKHLADCKLEGDNISVTLTQAETFLFQGEGCVEIQVRVKTEAGDVLASNIMRTSCERCLSCEVL